jgi:aspartate aminotransferase-like enzyme
MKGFTDQILFTPGPVSVPPRVLEAGGRAMIHHRTAEFRATLDRVIQNMKKLFGTAEDVLLVHATGRGAMEGALRNLFSPGEKILSVCNGKFGRMFADIGEACDLEVLRVFEEWLEPVIPGEIERFLRNDPAIKGVTVVHSDTSSAVENPIREIGDIARRNGRLVVVDCIGSLGAMAFNLDEWNIDVAITASQKGLMSPTGISFVAINQRGWSAVETAEKPGYYINFKSIRDAFREKKETPGSTPVSLVMSVNESLKILFEEGLENVNRRHAAISQGIKKGVQAMGLKLLPEGDVKRSHSVTLVEVPDGLKPAELRRTAKEKYGVMFALAQGDLKERAFRIGHLGMTTAREALLIVSVLELVLLEYGITDRPGKGLEAFYTTLRDFE